VWSVLFSVGMSGRSWFAARLDKSELRKSEQKLHTRRSRNH
jgi:hypothetical protein